MEELEALIILNSLPSIGSVKIRLLIRHYGSAVAALNTPSSELATFPGFSSKVLEGWKQGIAAAKWKDDLILAEQTNTHIISYTDVRYPKRLLEIVDYPLILYVQGNIVQEDQRSLAVIGTRQASIYGQEMAKKISGELARLGFTVVSGLARGIDTAAHQGAIENGRTIAVLGSGLSCLYPTENIGLSKTIVQQGALMSEFAMSTPPDRQNFPQRNRIVSGMSLGTILIEAPLHSGAMLTASKALSQNRPVFALPGRVDTENFKGNHALIKQGKAELIENIQDIVKNFSDGHLPLIFKSNRQPKIPVEKEEQKLLERMTEQETSIEELVSQIQWPVAKINVLLMSLVLKKLIKEYPGKIYKKI